MQLATGPDLWSCTYNVLSPKCDQLYPHFIRIDDILTLNLLLSTVGLALLVCSYHPISLWFMYKNFYDLCPVNLKQVSWFVSSECQAILDDCIGLKPVLLSLKHPTWVLIVDESGFASLFLPGRVCWCNRLGEKCMAVWGKQMCCMYITYFSPLHEVADEYNVWLWFALWLEWHNGVVANKWRWMFLGLHVGAQRSSVYATLPLIIVRDLS